LWRRAATVDDIFGYGSGGSKSLSQKKLRKADGSNNNGDRDGTEIATCGFISGSSK
jgi:hypothetical protein